MTEDNNEGKKKVTVEFKKAEDFKQAYAIGAVGGHSPYDFRIGFYNDSQKGFGQQSDSRVIERTLETEVILSPMAAYELSKWLNQHIQEYENLFGPISRQQAQKTEKNENKSDSSELQGYM
ncbi:conserved hypothetical protein [Methanohalobium evestigatum Z-7303]|jgi:hypothetical protein|uniref:DUF3467 domain-containing protein n=1 Tax=Methanohalobium evestigatum (strain ATCC BAA-1072 / DSM 3721 / NBRC 107634 / OCM 161 / Z-7303) TaxID=644295 RepID=D7EA62_METEZ|nr:DUF3467 domain-containing protein [Methanohalobium evestigatum]ADI74733.1 conserved hypothetical protein [Methanohalobium evestigatum Z-7303]